MYDDHLNGKNKWEQDRNTMEEEKKSLELAREQDKVRIAEFDVSIV